MDLRRRVTHKGDIRREPATRKPVVLRRGIDRYWRKYKARNRDGAHLAANVLPVLAIAFGCELIAGESLKPLKSPGRGRHARGKWRDGRDNTQNPPPLEDTDAGVTKAYLYNHPELRDHIETLRASQRNTITPQRTLSERTESSREVLLAAKDRRIKELEQENQRLKEELKMALGKLYEQI
jgi:hypothetical protein